MDKDKLTKSQHEELGESAGNLEKLLSVFDNAVTLCKKLPNDAELGRELRKILTEQNARTLLVVAKVSSKKSGK